MNLSLPHVSLSEECVPAAQAGTEDQPQTRAPLTGLLHRVAAPALCIDGVDLWPKCAFVGVKGG